MSSFSAQWLDLREPLDAASRAPGLAGSLIEALTVGRQRSGRLAIVDLGAGTGANLRYAAPLIGGAQDWLLVDNDPTLQAAVAERMRAWVPAPMMADCRVRHLTLDLATQLQQLPLTAGTLLTASALLDLVSEQWLRGLAGRAADAAASVWFALSYDGRIDCLPGEPEDGEVRELFNLHQRRDKGFGPALGPAAARVAEEVFTQQGYRIDCAPSDWYLGPTQPALQHALVQGWFEAACDIAPHRTPALRGWLTRRQAHIDAARSQLQVGHVDLVGRPA